MKKILRFILLLVFLILVSCVIFLNTHDYKQTINTDSIYSIVTYNIGYLSGMTNNTTAEKPRTLFNKNLKKVTKEFALLNTDIIALQEIDYDAARSYHINQQDEIAKLGYNYTAKAINWDETYLPFPYWPPSAHFGKVVSGQSILSKYPLKTHERIVLPRVANAPFYRDVMYLDRLAQITTVAIENREVIIINVHLEAFDKPTRIKQLDTVITLLNTYKKEYPVIILGDFNSAPTSENPAINKILALQDIGNAAFQIESIANTFNSKEPSKRIDYIFYTKNTIEYIDGKVLSQFEQASDHLPLEMRFKLH